MEAIPEGDCNLSETIREATYGEAQVTIIIRPPKEENDKSYHEILHKDGVRIFHNQKIHAKMVVVDRALAIVSSMNFILWH